MESRVERDGRRGERSGRDPLCISVCVCVGGGGGGLWGGEKYNGGWGERGKRERERGRGYIPSMDIE